MHHIATGSSPETAGSCAHQFQVATAQCYGNEGCVNIFGIMCYLAPDSIPQALFELSDKHRHPPELRYCSDDFLLPEMIDELLEQGFIERDMSLRILSLHRIVQQQFRFFSSPTDNQRFFDSASYLLFEAFPQSDAKRRQLYDRWAECQSYSQHVLHLRNQYKEAETGEAPLLPTLKFCRLLKSLARFLLESASYKEIQETLSVATSAFQKLRQEDADLCGSSGVAWAQQGFFTVARPWLEQAHKIRAEADSLDRLELSWAEVNLGNLEAAENNGRLALEWHMKALRNRQVGGGDETIITHPEAVIYKNMASAAQLLEGKLAEAQEEYSRARQVWSDKGQMLTHHFHGACLYKLGCVSFDQGDVDTSIKYLQESLVIAKLHRGVLTGDYARVLYKFAVVLGSREENKAEAEAKMNEAEAIARDRLDLGEDVAVANEEQTYDELVYIHWR